MLPMTQQCTGQPPTKNNLNQDVSGEIVEQDQLHNLQDPMQNENVGPHVQKCQSGDGRALNQAQF